MSRADDLYGAKDVDALFHEKPLTQTPWTMATRSKVRFDYDKEKVVQAVRDNLWHPKLEEVDPRNLQSTQGAVTRAGVQHYMKSNQTKLYGDSAQAGNRHSVIYKRDDGINLILSGTHRATAALLNGEQHKAIVVEGGWGHKR